MAIGKQLKACPICRSNEWTLNDDISFLPRVRITEGTTDVDLATGQPCAVVICRVCGSVQLFNLFFLGLSEKFRLKQAKD